jgi:tricorn protease
LRHGLKGIACDHNRASLFLFKLPHMPVHFKLRGAVAAAALLVASLSIHAGTVGFYRQPALHQQQLVFVAEGDLWQTRSDGGIATRLTHHAGLETSPAISPDGQWLAFVGQYDGTPGANFGDLYLMPISGGTPKRLTWDGLYVKVWGFTAQGDILFTAPTQNGQPGVQIYTLNPRTLERRALPVDQASDGALSADGRWLYFTRLGLSQTRDNARHYRGGAFARLWVLDLNSKAEARPLIKEGDNDRRPLPYQATDGTQRIAFLSDRDGSYNIWSVNAQGQDLRQHTHSTGWDIRNASIDGQRIAYEIGADVHVLDLADLTEGSDKLVKIELGGELDAQRQRFITKPQDYLSDVDLAPDGKTVALSSRGHLATQGTAEWRRAEMPQPADGRCREAAFSADSKHLFGLCDFSGEVEVWRFAANGLSKPEQITEGATSLRKTLTPSPDGHYLAHSDQQGHLFLTDLRLKGAAATRLIDQQVRRNSFEGLTWSADSRNLAYVRVRNSTARQSVYLYNLDKGHAEPIGSDRYDQSSPAFTPDGHWLYFLSDREFKASGNTGPWGDRNMGPTFDRRTRMYALALQADQRWPFAAPDELESPKDVKKDEKAEEKKEDKKDSRKDGKKEEKKDDKKEQGEKSKPVVVAIVPIDFTGLNERLYQVPLASGQYDGLQTDGKRLWWLESGADRKQTLKSLSIDNTGATPEVLSADVHRYAFSADRKKMMVERGEGAHEIMIIDAAPKLPGELARHIVRWSDWQIATDPKDEWRQMFADAWRMHRDTFYDTAMRGVDWAAIRRKYEPLVARLTDRAELGELLGMMTAELGTLHSQIVMPDLPNGAPEPAMAGLGARFSRQADGFRVEHIALTDPELPDQRPPLAQASVDLHVGDVITAINGRATREVQDLSELLRGQAGHQVLISFKRGNGSNGGAEQQRIVKPVTILRERALRYEDWSRTRAEAVQKAGQGRIGYLHLNAMVPDDIANFAREFYAQVDRDALIIDVRYNNGGNIDSWVLNTLMRRVWMYWQDRLPGGAPYISNMQDTFRGPMVVLANGLTYSDGETFTEGFKRLKLGPVIGQRTAGAGVWLSDQNRLADKGMARAAELAQILPDSGQQIIEGVGVTPDIEVDNLPRASFEGHDAQLDRAIAELKKRMAEQPTTMAKPLPFKPQQP